MLSDKSCQPEGCMKFLTLTSELLSFDNSKKTIHILRKERPQCPNGKCTSYYLGEMEVKKVIYKSFLFN